MALPGRRRGAAAGGGLSDTLGTFTTTANASYGINSLLGAGNVGGKPRSAGIHSDPAAGRRVDGLEQRLNGQEQSQRTLQELFMKLSQEVKMELKKKEGMLVEEKTARMRVEQSLQSATERLLDVEDKLKRVEESSRENKNALGQLIAHTKNVERAVTMNQQDLMQRKEAQAAKMQDLNHKLATMSTNRETLERLCYTMRDEISEVSNKVDNQSLEIKDCQGALRVQSKMFESQATKMVLQQGQMDNESGKKLSETQKAALEAKILQLQNIIMDLQSKLNHEKKEREVDQSAILTRVTECNAEISEIRRKRDTDLKELEAATKELASMSNAEKQRIVMQISSVQTELKRTMDERDLKLKQSTVNRLEEIEAEVKLESRQRLENEKEMRASLETSNNKVKLYTDECTEASRQMLSTEIETLRTRIQEVNETTNDLEIQFAELQTESKDQMTKSGKEAEGREKLLEAKIEDLSDRLRLGMGKLQQAIGESSASVKGKLATIDSTKIQLEDAEGLREKIRGEMNHLESQLVHLGSRLDGQQSVIEKQLRTHQQQGEEASTILGDKLQQKMDSVAFSQERMKRQLDDLQDRTQGAPTEIFDMRERMMDIERDFKATNKEKKITNERLETLETDVNHIMGRGETSGISGIPTLNRLLTELDETKGSHTKLSNEFDEFKKSTTDKLAEEAEKRDIEVEKLHQGQVRSEKRTKALKERVKKMMMPSAAATAGPDPDEIFEDEDEENE